jgi:translation elongation factor EF-G
MVEEATAALDDADAIVLVRDVTESFGSGDAHLLQRIESRPQPKLVVLNKIDRLAKQKLLPEIARYARSGKFVAIVPLSAQEQSYEAVRWSHRSDGQGVLQGQLGPHFTGFGPKPSIVCVTVRRPAPATGIHRLGWMWQECHRARIDAGQVARMRKRE